LFGFSQTLILSRSLNAVKKSEIRRNPRYDFWKESFAKVKSLQKSHALIPLNEGLGEQTCRANASHARHMAQQLLPEAH
jgi:hypothetical protein